MLNVNIRDNHLCLGVRVDEVPDGNNWGKLLESVIVEPIKCVNNILTLKIMTIRYEGNVGYRGSDMKVEIKLNEPWTSKNHGKRNKFKMLTKGHKEYNKYRKWNSSNKKTCLICRKYMRKDEKDGIVDAETKRWKGYVHNKCFEAEAKKYAVKPFVKGRIK